MYNVRCSQENSPRQPLKGSGQEKDYLPAMIFFWRFKFIVLLPLPEVNSSALASFGFDVSLHWASLPSE
jgi:hypothetical protein